MEIREALTIVRKLADGVHPETGEVLQSDCLYNNPQAVRALHRAVEALEFQDERERTKRFQSTNAGKSWSNQEDAQTCEELRRGMTFEQIAQIHNRTNGFHYFAAGAAGKDFRGAASPEDRMKPGLSMRVQGCGKHRCAHVDICRGTNRGAAICHAATAEQCRA